MKFSRVIGSVFALVLAFTAFQPAGAKPGAKYPDEIVKKSTIGSADDGIGGIYFSEKYPNQVRGAGSDKIHPGSDLSAVEVDAIQRFIKSRGSKKELYEVRYGVDVDAVAVVLIAAKNAGIPTQFVTDLNRSLKNDGTKPSSDFASMTFLDDGTAQTLQKIMGDKKGGKQFAFNDATYGVVSIPVYAKKGDTMIPIMHLKITIMVDRSTNPPSIKVFHSTGNLTNAQRVNTLIENDDPDVAAYYLEHIQTMIDVLRKGGQIKDMPKMAPLRVEYKDGSYRVIRFTDGHYNPNEYIAGFLNDAAAPGSKIKIKAIHGQEFVLTHRMTVDAIKAAMKAQKDFRVNLIADSRFVSMDGYGLASVLDGFNVYPKMGKSVYGVDRNLEGRTDLYVYSTLGHNEDGSAMVETNLDDAHITRKLEHNKVMIITYELDGVERAKIFVGSLNCSNHFDNAEDQEEIDVPTSSYIYKAFIQDYESIRDTQPDQVIPLPLHILREALGRMTGHTDLEMPLAQAKVIYGALLSRDYATVLKEIDGLRDLKTTLKKKVSEAEYRRRRVLLEKFFDWYKNDSGLPTSELSDAIRLRKLISIELILEKPEMTSWEAQAILNSILWRPNADEKQIQNAISGVWKVLGLKGQPDFTPFDPDQVSAIASSLPKDQAEKHLATYGKLTYWNFDWDDNIMFMPTPIVLYEVGGTATRKVTTAEYAKIKFMLGKDGKSGKAGTEWADWEVRVDSKNDSFYRFRRGSTGNYFLDDILEALHGITASPQAFQGPSWSAFVYALSNRDTAANVRIVTARDHSPDEMMEGLKELQKVGLIRYLPKKSNLIGVGSASNPAEAKVIKLRASIQEAEGVKIPSQAPQVIDPSGKGTRSMMLWGFSDDDYGNYIAAKEAIKAMMKAGEIKQTKITIFLTDKHNPEHPPEVKVITEDGGERDLVEGEMDEVKSFIQSAPKVGSSRLARAVPAQAKNEATARKPGKRSVVSERCGAKLRKGSGKPKSRVKASLERWIA